MTLDLRGEGPCFQLTLPFLDPGMGAQGSVSFLKIFARRVVFPPEFGAALVVNETSEAMLGLILVGKPRVKGRGFELSVVAHCKCGWRHSSFFQVLRLHNSRWKWRI